jgi:hypothetical protein
MTSASINAPSDLRFPKARNSAKNQNQPEIAIPVGDPSGKARRLSSGTVVRRAAKNVSIIAV